MMGSSLRSAPVDVPVDAAAPTPSVPATFVVPLDGSDFSLRAVPIAASFAERFGAEVVAVTTPLTNEDDDRLAVPAWLGDLARDGRYGRLRVAMVDDDPVDAVSMQVGANKDSVVCMATHSRGALGAMALGSVARDVVREVAVPVLLVGRHCPEAMFDTGPIVVCHDGSAASDAILAPVRAWSRHLELPIVVVQVQHPLDVPSAENPTRAVRPVLDCLGPGARAEVVVSSFPAGAIRDLAHELDASMIALSTHGRTGTARMVMGSVASWVTRESPCPVLTVRPRHLVAHTRARASS
jgi:nucleotide-binding universal stress UspA family protein